MIKDEIKKTFVKDNSLLLKNMTNDFAQLLKKYSKELFAKSIEVTSKSINDMIDDGNVIINKKLDKYNDNIDTKENKENKEKEND